MVGSASRPCQLCGSADVVLTRSADRRSGLAHLNPRFDPNVRVTESCRDCGSRALVAVGPEAEALSRAARQGPPFPTPRRSVEDRSR